MKTKLRRFVPRLLALDDRILPAVTIGYSPGSTSILLVTGDAGVNDITITDDGTGTGITIMADGEMFVATTPIAAIFVDTLGGNDTVVYNLAGPLTVNRIVDVQLGRGNDIYTANISGQSLATFVNLNLTANGEGGKDTLVLNAQSVSTAADSILNVDFRGGPGKDTITFDYTPGPIALGEVNLMKDQKN